MMKVFGHIAPDTDATGSAILWAWYVNTHTTDDATPYVLGPLNKETEFVLARWGFDVPELLEDVSAEDTVTIVDTNNPGELPPSIADATIVQILDHHHLAGGLRTAAPLSITARPVASTATIIHDTIGSCAEDLPDNIAGLMLSCILSDTLAFRSPTTTPHDKDIAEKLAAQLDIDLQAYADEMFAAKSDVSEFSDKGLLTLDSKKVPLGNIAVRISVIETTAPQVVLERKDGLVQAMEDMVQEDDSVDAILFFVVDILQEEATALIPNDLVREIIATSFAVEVEGDTEVLPGIVSRKKQILPALKLPEA